MYHFNPRKKKIDAYGRVSGGDIIDAPKTTLIPNIIAGKRINRIIWDEALTKLRIQGGKVIPDPQHLPFDSFKSDLEDGKFPVIICFDLDGIYGIGDKESIQEAVGERLERVKSILDCISSPVLACIARSQTPRAYVPPELVDYLQYNVILLLQSGGFGVYKSDFQKN